MGNNYYVLHIPSLSLSLALTLPHPDRQGPCDEHHIVFGLRNSIKASLTLFKRNLACDNFMILNRYPSTPGAGSARRCWHIVHWGLSLSLSPPHRQCVVTCRLFHPEKVDRNCPLPVWIISRRVIWLLAVGCPGRRECE